MRKYAQLEGYSPVKKILIALVCDGCGAELKPGQDVVNSGWMIFGTDHGPGTDKIETVYCDVCSRTRSLR